MYRKKYECIIISYYAYFSDMSVVMEERFKNIIDFLRATEAGGEIQVCMLRKSAANIIHRSRS